MGSKVGGEAPALRWMSECRNAKIDHPESIGVCQSDAGDGVWSFRHVILETRKPKDTYR